MLALDYTLVVQIVTFLIFWFLLHRLVFTPFLRLLEEREKRTEGVRAEVEPLTEESERLRSQYEIQIQRAQEEGKAIKEAIRSEAAQEREILLSQAQEQAAKLLQSIREELQREVRIARQRGVREAEELARQMAEKILGRRAG